jgi:catechol 2,3-dioxygenase-like lactoylglutathione lyase family enzyme
MDDQVEHLVSLYDRGDISRRQLLQGLLALSVYGAASGRALGASSGEPLLRARTINHVTLYASDVARSRAFYQRLAGLPIRDEAKDFCEFRLEGGFLGLYGPEAGRRPGFDHFCLGIEGYNAKRVHAVLAEAVPDAQPTLENEDQVYVHDPDGVRVQFADVTYKR